MKIPDGQILYDVLSPVGETTVDAGHIAARLNTLNGKTVCEVWNGLFNGEKTFPKIRALLKNRYPDINIIPYTELPIVDIVRTEKALKDLHGAILQKNCDAIITGNGG